jgi:uncharacterized protein YndB with AHSA1/START domain
VEGDVVGHFELTRTSSASAERLFDIFADGAAWSDWAGPTIRWSGWERQGHPEPGGVGAIRLLGSQQRPAREEIVEYERPHRLSYKVLSGLPVRDYLGTIALEARPDGGTLLRWSADYHPSLPYSGWFVRRFLVFMLGGFAKRAVVYAEASAETGNG